MEREFWLERWRENQIGFHQPQGHPRLRKHWADLGSPGRVLVPLCGKTPDLLWLAQHGFDTTGVELSEIAVRSFFSENALPFEEGQQGGLRVMSSTELPLKLIVGDFFAYTPDHAFDALYDRAALIALPESMRPGYVRHCRSLLRPDGGVLLITLRYNADAMDGPPFPIEPEEIARSWPELELISDQPVRDVPKGLGQDDFEYLREQVWARKAV